MAEEFHWTFWDGQSLSSLQSDPPAYTFAADDSDFGSESRRAAGDILTYLSDVFDGVRGLAADLWSETTPGRSAVSSSISSYLAHAPSSMRSLWRITSSAVSSGVHSTYGWLNAFSPRTGDSARIHPRSCATYSVHSYMPWASERTKDGSRPRLSGQQMALLPGLGLVTLSVLKNKLDRASAIDVLKLSALAGGVIISHKSLQDVDWSSCARPGSDK